MTGDTTPVLVGIGRRTQRVDDPGGGFDAVELMVEVTRDALLDGGAADLASRIATIFVPRGMWRHPDPGRVIADAIGASSARTIVAEVGVLQHSLITAACEQIAQGRADAVLVVGGEARYRDVVASRAGVPATQTEGDQSPDAILRPDGPIVSDYEIERGVVMPAIQYAMVQNAYAHAAAWSEQELRGRLGTLWSHYADVASRDPLAWDRSAPGADAISTPSAMNRMVATPFTRLLCSQWNVDQAAALIFASAGAAQELGIAQDRCVFPVASAESNAMIPMLQREQIHRWPAFRLAAKTALDLAGLPLNAVEALEIYSCFPSAVLVQLNEMGIERDRELTVTGGMTFGGGPLNNFVLQATVAMAERIRATGMSTGVVTGVSGMLTKPGVAVWAKVRPPHGFHSADVTDETYRRTPTRAMTTEEAGRAKIVGVTVSHGRDAEPMELAVLELADGSRMVGRCPSPGNPVGADVQVTEPGLYLP